MKLIDLREWKVNYTDFTNWVVESGADVYAIIHHGGNGASAQYGFENEEDYLAFKLKFTHEKSNH